MFTPRFGTAMLAAALVAGLCGCGVSSPPATASSVATSNLAGNWLIFGTLPFASNILQGPPAPLAFAESFDVEGTQVTATANFQDTCSPGGGSASFGATAAATGSGSVLSGTLAQDGTLNVSTSAGSPLFPTLTVTGTEPAVAGSSWNGTYSITQSSGVCIVSLSGPFTATRIADVDGTFTGSGTIAGSLPVSLSLTLQQGALLYSYSLSGNPSISSRLALDGSIQIQGFTCFSKGTISTQGPSEVEGNVVAARFTMDDGSLLVLGGVSRIWPQRRLESPRYSFLAVYVTALILWLRAV